MAISYIDIDELTQKVSVDGTEKLPVSDTEYITPAQIVEGSQPLNADLTAIAELAGTSGVLKKTADNTWALDTDTFYTSANANRADKSWIADRMGIGVATSISYRLNILGGDVAIRDSSGSGYGIHFKNDNNNVDAGYLFFQSGGLNGFKVASKNGAWASRQSLVFYRSNSQSDPFPFTETELMRLGYDGVVAVTGNITATGTITPGSDARIKGDQREIDGKAAMEIIGRLTPKTWTWNEKSGEQLEGKKAAGLVAQEVADVIPDAVVIGEGCGFDDFHALNYNTIQGYELAAIKELIAEVKALRAEIEELKKK